MKRLTQQSISYVEQALAQEIFDESVWKETKLTLTEARKKFSSIVLKQI